MLRVRQLQRDRGHRELHRQGAVGKDRSSSFYSAELSEKVKRGIKHKGFAVKHNAIRHGAANALHIRRYEAGTPGIFIEI